MKFPSLQVLDQGRGFVRVEDAGKGRHIASPVQDAEYHLSFGEAIADIRETGSAQPAQAIHCMAILTSFVMEEHLPVQGCTGGGDWKRVRQRRRIETRRPWSDFPFPPKPENAKANQVRWIMTDWREG